MTFYARDTERNLVPTAVECDTDEDTEKISGDTDEATEKISGDSKGIW